VPSCCVLTSTGLSKVLPNAPGYVSTQEVQQAVVRDVCQGGGCALWGSKAPVALGPEKTAASAAGELRRGQQYACSGMPYHTWQL
jgi:hypothetical protein